MSCRVGFPFKQWIIKGQSVVMFDVPPVVTMIAMFPIEENMIVSRIVNRLLI